MSVIHETCSCGATFDMTSEQAVDVRLGADRWRRHHHHEFAPQAECDAHWFRTDTPTEPTTQEDGL